MAESPDFRFYTGWLDEPQWLKLQRRHEAWGFVGLCHLLAWAACNRPTGNLAGMSDEDIEIAARWTREPGAFTRTIVELGFLDGSEGSYRVHAWGDEQSWCLERLDRRRRAKANGQKAQAARTEEEKRNSGKHAANARWDKERTRRLTIARRKKDHTAEEEKAVLEACEHRCVECGRENVELELDHIVPIRWEWRDDATDGIENLQPKCRRCNASRKADDETDLRREDWAERFEASMRARSSHDANSSSHDASSDANSQPNPAQPSKMPAKVKSKNPNAPRIEAQPVRGLAPAERDSWDFRRWREEMDRLESAGVGSGGNSDERWCHWARTAAFRAGVSPQRIVELLKQHFPDDPAINQLYPELVSAKAATA